MAISPEKVKKKESNSHSGKQPVKYRYIKRLILTNDKKGGKNK
jgi:hypothetical protein